MKGIIKPRTIMRTSTKGNTEVYTLTGLLQTSLRRERKSEVEITTPLFSLQELDQKKRQQR